MPLAYRKVVVDLAERPDEVEWPDEPEAGGWMVGLATGSGCRQLQGEPVTRLLSGEVVPPYGRGMQPAPSSPSAGPTSLDGSTAATAPAVQDTVASQVGAGQVGAAGVVSATNPAAEPASTPGPIRRAERSLAPDLARGGVLLGIALANVPIYLYGGEFGAGSRPVDGSTLDRVLDFVVTLFVNDRSRPMFALLFGFGIATMLRRMTERGIEPRRRTGILVRRNLLLVAFGAVHAGLLFEGDILGIYGATGLIALLLFNRSPRVLVGWGVASLLLLGVTYGVFEAFPAGAEAAAEPQANYLASVVERLGVFVIGVVGSSLVLLVLAPTLIGIAMARAGLLDRPWEHVGLLRRLAAAGLLTGVAGGLPYALVVAGVWQPGVGATAVLAGVHVVTGTAMGVGYVSLFGLWAAGRHAATARRSGVAAVLAAVGERSLTCYLLQSLLFAPLLAPWGLAVGGRIGTAEAYGIAVLVWLAGVAAAWGLARAGRRGPFEVLLRRLTYGRPVLTSR